MAKKILFLLIFIAFAFGIFLGFRNVLVFKNSSPAGLSNIDNQTADDETELKAKIGQMLIVGFRGTEAKRGGEIYNIIKDVNIGGVILFDYDVPSGNETRNISNPAQVKKLVSDLKNYSDWPLFVSVDQEGGNVSRLKPKYGFLETVSAFDMAEKNITAEESEKLAGQLANLGFNMNMAPVVDLNINPKNPIIGRLERSFSADAQAVVDNAKIFIKNHIEKNIIPVEKHFPGQGNATIDTHLGLADVTDTYRQEELIPYRSLNRAGLLDVVMVAHTINKNIDEKYPATLSKKFLADILRKEIGFKGVIMSDDMQMAAITDNFGFEEAIIQSINAGMDILVFSNNTKSGYDSQIAYRARDIIFQAVKNNKIPKERIEESYNRIIGLKNKYRISDNLYDL